MLEQRVEIINKLGLHARAAAKLVSTAMQFESDCRLAYGTQEADCKSIMSVMMLAAAKGSEVVLSCDGKDEQAALGALVALIDGYFGEEE